MRVLRKVNVPGETKIGYVEFNVSGFVADHDQDVAGALTDHGSESKRFFPQDSMTQDRPL